MNPSQIIWQPANERKFAGWPNKSATLMTYAISSVVNRRLS
jgi:hypothetical protein